MAQVLQLFKESLRLDSGPIDSKHLLSYSILLVAGLITVAPIHKGLRRFLSVAAAVVAAFGPPQSLLLALWIPLDLIIMAWHTCLRFLGMTPPTWLVHGGPLGRNMAKVCHAVSAFLAAWLVDLRSSHARSQPRETITPIYWGPVREFESQDWMALAGTVLFVSVAVNAVLQLWSSVLQTRGRHEGVHDVVKESRGRSLTLVEQRNLWVWALVNAVVEEWVSRGVWRRALAISLHQRDTRVVPLYSNFAQAAIFGFAHFKGIPSGWSGVCLATLYGLVMGVLQDIAGLGLAVAAHTVADYYIFAILARQAEKNS